ncbi:MAG: PEP-CTERM sorting domain-containing protein [Bryobacteraceae bacterium]
MKAHHLLSLATLALGTLGIGSAASITNFDLGSGGTNVGSGFGNVRTWTNVQGTGITITATAFSASSVGTGLVASQLGQYSGLGLGVCNPGEGTGCGDPNHQVDNSGYYDFVLFTFSAPVSALSFVADPYGNYDSDATYYTRNGNSGYTILGKTLAQLVSTQGFNSPLNDDISCCGNTNTVPVTGSGITSILFGTRVGGDSHVDYFKIHTLSATTTPGQVGDVPEPATFGLLGASLLGIGLMRRRSQKR